MPNATRLFRYSVVTTDGNTTRNMRVRADVSAITLVLGSSSNTEPNVLASNLTFEVILQGRGGPKTKISYARSVTIRMAAAAPPLSVGSLVVVPIFRRDAWNPMRVGQAGTYMGAACVCVAKKDGSPDVRGREL